MCMCIDLCMQVAYREARCWCWGSCLIPSTLHFETESLTEHGGHSDIHLSLAPLAGTTDTHSWARLFKSECWGSTLMSSSLCGKCFSNWSISSPGPQLSFKYLQKASIDILICCIWLCPQIHFLESLHLPPMKWASLPLSVHIKSLPFWPRLAHVCNTAWKFLSSTFYEERKGFPCLLVRFFRN